MEVHVVQRKKHSLEDKDERLLSSSNKNNFEFAHSCLVATALSEAKLVQLNH